MPRSHGPGPAEGDPKMVLVVRGELRLTAGKAAAQAAHAAVLLTLEAQRRHPEALAAWLRTGQKKIVLTVPSLGELEALARQASARKIPHVWVDDAGLTEVAPGTRTCLGLGPASSAAIDPVTGSLDLL
jgi:PTH2 family peptidyl-tRNA hydrolase